MSLSISEQHTPVKEEFEHRLRQQSQDRLQNLIGDAGLDAVTWLALPPVWTRELARACNFPTRSRPLEEFVERMGRAQMCATARSPSPAATADQAELRLLGAAAPYLSPTLQERALSAAARATGTRRRRILSSFAAGLHGDGLKQAIELADEIDVPSDRADVFVSLAAAAPPPERDLLVQVSIEAARQLRDPRTRARALATAAGLADFKAALSIAGDAIAIVSSIDNADEHDTAFAETMEALVRVRGDGLPAAVAETVVWPAQIREPGLVSALAPFLPAPRGLRLLEQAAESARTLVEAEERDNALYAVVESMIKLEALDEAVALTEAISQPEAQALARASAAAAAIRAGDPGRATNLVGLARATIVSGSSSPTRELAVLTGIAALLMDAGDRDLAPELVLECVELARHLTTETDAVYALATVAALLEQAGDFKDAATHAERALSIALRFVRPRKRCEWTTMLLSFSSLSEPVRSQALQAALEAARALSTPLERASVLPALLPHLDPGQREAIIVDSLELAARTEEELTFWMPDPARTQVVDYLHRLPNTTGAELAKTAATVAVAILQAGDSGVPVPGPARRWATLARVQSVNQVAGTFDHEVTRALEARDLGGVLDWIDTASALAAVIGDELDGAVRYARRRMELVYRRIDDERHLESFLERHEQLEAFRQLLADRSGSWALHFIGAGGVGKTMLLRHITRAAAREGIATSRVDFDYLSPDYPVRRPAQLLLELMAELQFYATSGHGESLVQSFRDSVVKLHESAQLQLEEDPLDYIRGNEFAPVLRSFCDYLRLLNRPVVLILDTCEELGKFHAEGDRLPNVEATFAVIQQVAEAVEAVRVIFSGRRLLAGAGAGWEVKADAPHTRALLPVARSYLRLHEIRGFTAAEAHAFILQIRKLELPADVVAAILRESRDPGSVAEIEWTTGPPPEPEERYSPFDVAGLADWVSDAWPVAPDQISSTSMDLYIDRRIVGRIRSDDVRRLIPTALLLRRFDERLLREVFVGSVDDFREAFKELINQEWVHARFDPAMGAPYFIVDANLHRRLTAYYQQPARRAYVTQAAAALAPKIEQRVTDSPLGELSSELLNSAMELLPGERAAALWHDISLRAVQESRWDWVRQVTAVLLGEAGAVQPTHPARASVRATLASALLHTTAETNLEGHWREVERYAGAEPDPVVRAWLRARAAAGRVTSEPELAVDTMLSFLTAAQPFFPPAHRRDSRPDDPLVAELAASCCAAIESAVELSERMQMPVPHAAAVLVLVDALTGGDGPSGMIGFARMLAARMLALEQRWEAADASRRSALAVADELDQDDNRQWLDWVAPASIVDRIRLEALRLERFASMPLSSAALEHWRDPAISRLGTIDAERLLSAMLRRELDHALPSPDQIAWLDSWDVYDPRRQPVCNAHHATPPLCAPVAFGLAAVGDVERALSILDGRIRAATQSASDPVTVGEAELARLQVVRRLRLPTETTPRLGQRSSHPGVLDAALAASALTFPPDWPARLWRSRQAIPWRYQTALTPDWRERVSPRPGVGSGGDDPEGALDLIEWRMLDAPEGEKPRPFFSHDEWLSVHPSEPERALRLSMRAAALGVDKGDPAWYTRTGAPLESWERGPLSQRHHRLGELALEEGEMLALRLPAHAVALLAYARTAFKLAGDPLGALIASIRATIAHAHAGHDDARHTQYAEMIDDARAAQAATVRALTPALTALLDWDELRPRKRRFSWRDDPEMSPPPKLAPGSKGTGLEGWLERLDVALDWCLVKAQPPEQLPPSPRPIELDLHAASEARRAAASRRSRPSAGPVLTVIFAIALVLGFYGGIGFAVQAALNAVAPGVFGYPASVAIGVGMVLLFVVYAQGAGVYGRALKSLAMARNAMSLTVEAGNEPVFGATPWPPTLPASLTLGHPAPAPAAGILSPLVLQLQLVVTLLRTRRANWSPPAEGGGTHASWQTPPCGPYGAISASFPRGIADQVLKLARRRQNSVIPICADVPQELEGLPWEAFVLRSVHSAGRHRRGFEVYRRCRTTSSSPAPPLSRQGGVGVVSSRAWRPMAVAGWSSWPRQAVVVERLDLPWAQPLAVLHLVGRVVTGTSGYLLRVDGGSDPNESVEVGVRQSGQVLAASEVRASPGALVILQAEPFDVKARFDTDREESAKLRLLAREILDAGAPAILAIPALPPELAGNVIGIACQAMREPRFTIRVLSRAARSSERRMRRALRDPLGRSVGPDPSVQPLLRALVKVRSLIADYDQGGAEQGIFNELADDLCLFVRDRLDD